MTLFMLRLDPDPHAAARWFAGEDLASMGADDGGYRWHALLAAAFGKAHVPKPYRVHARRGRPLQILAYSGEEPAALDAAARAFADPLALAALGLDQQKLTAKPMPPFTAGRKLGFSLLVRPTLRIDRGGDRRRSAEIDAYVAALRQADAAGERAPERSVVYRDWAASRIAAGGARVLDLRIDGLEQVPSLRRNAERQLTAVQGHAAQVAGTLEVVDGDAFAALVARGVGRHRAFGYGMLLLSPA
jgi:CRISPR system Cascade subunit CasE